MDSLDFNVGDVVLTDLDGNKVEGTITKITGVDSAKMKTRWGIYNIDLGKTSLVHREEIEETHEWEYDHNHPDHVVFGGFIFRTTFSCHKPDTTNQND